MQLERDEKDQIAELIQQLKRIADALERSNEICETLHGQLTKPPKIRVDEKLIGH